MMSNCNRLSSASIGILLFVLLATTLSIDAFNNNNLSHHRANMSSAKKQKLNDTTKNNGNEEPSPLQPIKAGFIGCGTIASAIATSLATPDHTTHLAHGGFAISSICVTRRSESKSGKLKEDFHELVTVYDSPQDVVENSDLVFLCVLPQQVDSVLEDLGEKGVWRPEDHTLVSLVVCINDVHVVLGYVYVYRRRNLFIDFTN